MAIQLLLALSFVFGILNMFFGAIDAEHCISEKQRKNGYIRMYIGIAMTAAPILPLIYVKLLDSSLNTITIFGAFAGIVSITLVLLIFRSAFTE